MCSREVFFLWWATIKWFMRPIFGRLFTQHCKWTINFTFLSCLDIACSHASMCKYTLIFCRHWLMTGICLVLCTKLSWPCDLFKDRTTKGFLFFCYVFWSNISPRVENRSPNRMMNLGCIHHLWEFMSHFLTFDYKSYREQDKLNYIWI